MEGLSSWREDAAPEHVDQLLCALIDIEKMLPKAVARHFELPYLYVAGAHFNRGDAYRRQLVSEITTALKVGLESADADPQLERGGGADFGDRPRSRGEEVLEAAVSFKNEMTRPKLSQLQTAIFGTNLRSRVKTIEMLLTRKRPYGNQDPMVAMYGELHRLEFEAEGYFSVRA